MEGLRLTLLGRSLIIIREDYCFIAYILSCLYLEFSSVLLKLIMTDSVRHISGDRQIGSIVRGYNINISVRRSPENGPIYPGIMQPLNDSI